ENARLGQIGHPRLETIDVDDVVLLALANAPAVPVERVLPQPDQGPDSEGIEPQFFPQFAPQSLEDGLARFQPATGRDPKRLIAVRRPDPQQQDLVRPGQQNGADRVALNDQRLAHGVWSTP